MKKLYFLFLLFISSFGFAQAPLLIEDFDYPTGDALIAHGWFVHSGTTAPILVTSPGLTFTGYVGSNIGGAAGVLATGQDVNKLFPEQATGTLYASFLVNVANTLPTAGGYFFHYFDPILNTAHRGRLFVTPETGKVKVGFSFNASAAAATSNTLLDFGTTYLFVVKYTIVEGAANDIVSLYVFPAGADISVEPATPTLGPLTATLTTDPIPVTAPDIKVSGIALRQFVALQGITVDGIRVKTNWDLAKDNAPAVVTVNPTTLSVPATTSSKSIVINSNYSWTATKDQDWLTLSSASGASNATVTVTAAENITTVSRTGVITVSVPGAYPQMVIVTQDAKPFVAPTLIVSPATLSVAAAANSSKSFKISSNIAWTASKDQDWLTLSTTSGSENATVTVTATENTTTSTRAATVTVSGQGVTAQTVTVTQDGKPIVIPALTVASNAITVGNAANSKNTIKINSNIAWTITKDKDWLTLSSTSGSENATITVTAAENATTSARTATVTVAGTNVTSQLITVTQSGKLLLVEDFDYPVGDALTAHGWNVTGTNVTDPILVTSPGLTFAGYVGSNIGGAAGVVNNNQDVNKLFLEQTIGSVYTSFLVNVATNTTVNTGPYFFHYYDPNANTQFRARTYLTPTTGKLQVGFSFNASTAGATANTLLDFGVTYLFVVKYTIVDGAGNDNVSLYVFPAGSDLTNEPATPTLGPLVATSAASDIRPMGIALRQYIALQGITVDGIRVNTNWNLKSPVTAINEVKNSTSSTLTVYPNPATNGQLFINSESNSPKQIDIYNAIGRKVLSEKTTLNTININNLASGIYILKIEADKVISTSKLIVK